MRPPVPELVPASMLGAYTYCPRLFFLEWVDALWAANADLAEGRRVHTHVDVGGGAAPLPENGELRAARSVSLSSERLGITATIDLLEADPSDDTDTDDAASNAGGVVCVETEKGHPTDEGTAWESDAAQVCAQVLLVRDQGYTCRRGEIFYAATRQRGNASPSTQPRISSTEPWPRSPRRDHVPSGCGRHHRWKPAASAPGAAWSASAYPMRPTCSPAAPTSRLGG